MIYIAKLGDNVKLNRSQLRRLILQEANSLNERVDISKEDVENKKAFAKEFHDWEREQYETNEVYDTYDKAQNELYNMYIEKAKELETKYGLVDNEYSSKIKNALENTDDDLKRIIGNINRILK